MLFIAAGFSIAGCSGLVGIGELPLPDAAAPSDGAGPEAAEPDGPEPDAAQPDGPEPDAAQPDAAANADASGDEPLGDAIGDETTRDATAHDARLGDGAEDARMDHAVTAPDADDGSPADSQPIRDAGIDDVGQPSCPLVPDTSGQSCETCLQSHCCAELGACEAPDNTGLNDAGESACIQLTNVTLLCIVAVGDPSASCTQAGTYSQQAQQEATALVTCIQQACATQCQGIISVPGI